MRVRLIYSGGSTVMLINKAIDLSGLEYFHGEHGVLILGDSREVLKRVPSASVDVVLTDPPWGVGFDEYDDFNVFLQVRDELYRVMKPDSWLVFFHTPKRIYDIQPYLQRFRYVWMIPYIYASFGSHSRNPLGSQATYSIIMVFAKGEPKIKTSRRDLIYSDELPVVEGNVREPQFKPTFTVSVLVTMFTREGDLVLDPFAGYGSIPLVCELFRRRWMAVERDPIKYQIARRIIETRKVPDIKRLKEEIKSSKSKIQLTELHEVGEGRTVKPNLLEWIS
jgi:DNA modification methylase